MADSSFNPSDLNADPIKVFEKLFARVQKIDAHDASAMTLATANKEGKPTARMVLFKGIENGAFKFYTNYQSDKAHDLHSNPQAALVFYWHPVYQQIRIEGAVEKTSREDSDKYFRSRPRESQLAAAASSQSKILKNREELVANFEKAKKFFEGREVECPLHWGGYKVIPQTIEFWFGSPHRLHDRVCYTKKTEGEWKMEFLNP